MTLSITSLFSTQTAAQLFAYGLELADALGLTSSSWRDGDPTLSLYDFVSDVLATRDEVAAEYIKAGFLSSATGDWLTLLASELYGVTREEATYATSTLTLENSGGGYYTIEAGDLAVKSSTSDKTYHSSNAVPLVLSPGSTETIEVIADEAGSDSSAGANEIDTLVSTYLGVAITASTAAVGIDQQGDAALRTQCRATTGALSPNGPPDAYEYVARSSALTGSSEITRASSVANSSTGAVTIYVAGASGQVSGGAVTAAQDAIELWATPLCITPTVVNATEVELALTATVSGDDIPLTVEDDVESAYGVWLAAQDIGATISRAGLIALIYNLLVAAGASNVIVTLTVPASDTVLTASQVAVPGTVTVTEV